MEVESYHRYAEMLPLDEHEENATIQYVESCDLPDVRLQIDATGDLFSIINTNCPILLGALKKREFHSLTPFSYFKFLASKANVWRVPVAHQVSSFTSFVFSHIPSPFSFLPIAFRGLATLHQMWVPYGVFNKNSRADSYYGSSALMVPMLAIMLALYAVADVPMEEVFTPGVTMFDVVLHTVFSSFFTVNSGIIGSGHKEWRTNERFAIEEIAKAVQNVPSLRDDPRLYIKDAQENPITLPAYIVDIEAAERKYYQLPDLLGRIQRGEIDAHTAIYFDQEYFWTVVEALMNPLADSVELFTLADETALLDD